MNASKHVLTAVDLFAGVGGIRLGFEYAFNGSKESNTSLDTVYVCEQDAWARKTYKQNFSLPDAPECWGYDIRSADVKAAIPDFNICLAGFPCQAFSNAGHKQGFEDEKKRGTLFFEVSSICRKHRPDVIFCENVKGLYYIGQKQPNGYHRIYNQIRQELIDLGYEVQEAVLNSADFGVPQNRERLYIVAFRKGILAKAAEKGVVFSFPASNEHAEVAKRWATSKMRDIRDPGKIPSKYYLSERYMATLRRHRENHREKGHGFGFVIRDWDGLSGTILCSNMGRERNLVIDHEHEELIPWLKTMGPLNKDDIRKLTPREFMKLQGFPKDFNTEGVPDTQLYKQFGNSVTVPVIEAIAREIRLVLEAADVFRRSSDPAPVHESDK